MCVKCRHVLARANPLLADIAEVDGGTIDVTLTPERMQLPSERTTVRLAPARHGAPFRVF